jgi:hypothetical protein
MYEVLYEVFHAIIQFTQYTFIKIIFSLLTCLNISIFIVSYNSSTGGIPKLVRLAGVPQVPVRIEAIAALANLAVNGKK